MLFYETANSFARISSLFTSRVKSDTRDHKRDLLLDMRDDVQLIKINIAFSIIKSLLQSITLKRNKHTLDQTGTKLYYG